MSESRDALIARRYAKPQDLGDEGNTWSRIADFWSGGDERQRDELSRTLSEGRAMLNTPALANASNNVACGSACYVLPVNDSLTKGPASITQTLMDATAVHQYGGGTGFNLSRLRPEGSRVESSGREASGPMSFLEGYSAWFKTVTQAGLREAANMGIMEEWHPDAMKFVTWKQPRRGETRAEAEKRLTNFNLSLSVSDQFMQRVSVEGGVTRVYGHHTEHELWRAVVEGAWNNGEPGLFFRDTVNRSRLHPELYECTNPCGEVPLLEYEACVLGSVNLAAHLKPEGEMDWGALADTIHVMVRALDNVIDLQDYPLDIIRDTHRRYRKIGLGPMGYADMLCMLGLRYGSENALGFTEYLAEFMQHETYKASWQLAKERGVYPGWNVGLPYRRNLCCNVTAPTGSISRAAACSFGIEPHMNVDEHGNYWSFILGGQYLDHEPFYQHPCFVPAREVTPEQHVLTQAAWQKYTDQAVSKTCNLPESATREDVARIFRLAWETGCKGITVLRENSREHVVIGTTDPSCKGGKCDL